MIRLEQISKSHGKKQVLNNVDLEVQQGDFIIVMGANGAGKTTLFTLLSGIDTPDSGAIYFKGQQVTKKNQYYRASWLGKLAQNPSDNVIIDMTVEENLALALLAQKKVTFSWALNVIDDTVYEMIKKEYHIDLAPLRHVPMKRLSGGQRQLIAFIMMTLSRPALLLLDEPTASLDTNAATTLLSAVVRFIQEHAMTALMITHDPEMAHMIGNKLWLVKNKGVTTYNEKEKKELQKNELMGHIDYQKILDS